MGKRLERKKKSAQEVSLRREILVDLLAGFTSKQWVREVNNYTYYLLYYVAGNVF